MMRRVAREAQIFGINFWIVSAAVGAATIAFSLLAGSCWIFIRPFLKSYTRFLRPSLWANGERRARMAILILSPPNANRFFPGCCGATPRPLGAPACLPP